MLGKLITNHTKRDATHVAILPAQAGMALRPGELVAIKAGRAYADQDAIGVVDPFLRHSVPLDGWFYICMNPDTVKNLRHAWDHESAVPESDDDDEEYSDGCQQC